jgi:hypothetical protein
LGILPGMTYLPGNKDVIEPPHKCICSECNRGLPTGIAYFVINDEREHLPVGPNCFEKLTGLRVSKALNLALGTAREEGKSSKGETANKFNESSITASEKRRKIAEENVLLRAEKLPERGFTNTDKEKFIEFLPRIKTLAEEDLQEIERRVAAVSKSDPCKVLSNLMRCKTVYGQLQRLLIEWKERQMPDENILKMRDQLCSRNGLVDWQMERVKMWSTAAKKCKIASSVEGIHFKENQARYDKWRQTRSP